jgi:hypothetical protein
MILSCHDLRTLEGSLLGCPQRYHCTVTVVGNTAPHIVQWRRKWDRVTFGKRRNRENKNQIYPEWTYLVFVVLQTNVPTHFVSTIFTHTSVNTAYFFAAVNTAIFTHASVNTTYFFAEVNGTIFTHVSVNTPYFASVNIGYTISLGILTKK